jgi:hypothetical protein
MGVNFVDLLVGLRPDLGANRVAAAGSREAT